MADPISLCVENVEGPDDELRFIRCVALEGHSPGLAIDPRGRPLWVETAGCACELCVATDGALVLLRPKGAARSRVHRAGRSVDVPESRPVVLLDQDELEVGATRLRLHVHGPTTEIYEPTPFVPPVRASVAVLAAAAVLGVAALGCDRSGAEAGESTAIGADTAAVTTAPSATTSMATTDSAAGTTAAPSPDPTSSLVPPSTASSLGSPGGSAAPTATGTKPPIEVRPRPPVAPRRDPAKPVDAF